MDKPIKHIVSLSGGKDSTAMLLRMLDEGMPVDEILFCDPLYYLLHDEPNPEMTSFIFRETLMTHLLLWGNAYAQIIRNGKGEVVGLYPLMPSKMTVDRDKNGMLYYKYQRTSDDSPDLGDPETVYLEPKDVLHIPGLGFDGLVGYSPIAMAKNAIGMAIACEEYGAKFFANGAAPSGVLEHPGTLKDPQKLRDSWNSTFGGSGNSNKVAVLEEGLKYTPISISPEQAQFLETRKFQVNEIARIFRVPPHMVGDLEKSSFSNIEQQSLEFVKYTLDPWVIRWEQSLARALFTPNEKKQLFFKFSVEGLLRGDYVSRMSGYATARQNGWMSANDIRELENLDRIPEEDGGDLYLVNGNMLPLKNAGAFANISTEKSVEEEVKPEDENNPSGVFLFKTDTHELKLLYSSGYYWNNYIEVDGSLLISSSNSNYGLLRYDYAEQTLTRIYSTGYYWNRSYSVTGGLLITSTSSGGYGILFYDAELKTAKCIYNNGYAWNYFHAVQSGYLLSSTNNYGIVFFDPAAKAGYQKYSTGWLWSDFVDDPLGCTIYPQGMRFIRSLHWNDAERSITEN